MYTVDLHGTKHEDARQEVIRSIEKYWGTGTELEIITGKSGQMKSIVLDTVQEYNVDYTIGRLYDAHKGSIIVWLE